MKTIVLAMLLVLQPTYLAHADRITRMNQADRCIYIAKLQVAGYYYFKQGKRREEVKVVWHGDETQNEIEFVNRTLDDAYDWLTNANRNGAELLPVETFGDLVYEACVNGKLL